MKALIIAVALLLGGCSAQIDENQRQNAFRDGYSAALNDVKARFQQELRAEQVSCLAFGSTPGWAQGLAGVDCRKTFSDDLAQVPVDPSMLLRPALAGLGLLALLGWMILELLRLGAPAAAAYAGAMRARLRSVQEAAIADAVTRSAAEIQVARDAADAAIRSKNEKLRHLQGEIEVAETALAKVLTRLDDQEEELARLETANENAQRALEKRQATLSLKDQLKGLPTR